jgi:quinohemoprotein ethanol dehydrogenase
LSNASAQAWLAIVRDGALQSNGMVGFGQDLSNEQAEAVRAYVIERAAQDFAAASTRQ